MGTIVLALVWIYHAALIVLVGALLTAVVDERAKEGRATHADR
jgi:membrane protein